MTDAPIFVHTHPDDNVIIIASDVAAGVEIVPGVVTTRPHRPGQKLALVAIPKGTDVLRYGAPIGFASVDIAPGELVHVHNVTSHYQHATTHRGGQP